MVPHRRPASVCSAETLIADGTSPLHFTASKRGRSATAHRRACALLRRCGAPRARRHYAINPCARRRPAAAPAAPHTSPDAADAHYATQETLARAVTQALTPPRDRRRDPHLRGGPGRRPQPPAHDGLLRGRQGQEGRDLRRVRRGRRRYRSLSLSNSVAQWIAYQTSNLGVAGSSPVGVVAR